MKFANEARVIHEAPKMKKIKMMCWLDEYNCLCWTSSTARSTWVRIPQQDIEIEVPDDK